jgi:hypothetical protein
MALPARLQRYDRLIDHLVEELVADALRDALGEAARATPTSAAAGVNVESGDSHANSTPAVPEAA